MLRDKSGRMRKGRSKGGFEGGRKGEEKIKGSVGGGRRR